MTLGAMARPICQATTIKTIMTANSNSVGLIRPPAAAALGGVYLICHYDIRRVAQQVAPVSWVRGT
jgi:hypothetical protein